ncbi:MAG TPA: 2-C-methyl-D-erythritol 4-phosphate cytidylyltransferase [Candidatus Limnocylindria bacterium]|nr:2-C-methyl-D-erythritol 4-phosphate cytidylyltransferase [Candidatus Limnocylindria bacterium]
MRRVLAILAAGSATRAGVDKVLADLGGQPVVAWSIAAGVAAGCFEEIVITAPAERVSAVAVVAADRARVIAGGPTRTASSWRALDVAGGAEIIAIHDAARPFVPPSLFARCVDIAMREGSAVAGLPLADTVRRADEIGVATEEISREGLWSVQTPQVFRRELLARARVAAGDASFSDDAAALANAGITPRMVLGERRNLKITTFEDLAYARELVDKGLVGFPLAALS